MQASQCHHYAIENENNYVLVVQGKYSKNELYSKTKNLQVPAHKSWVCFGFIILHGMVFTHHTSIDRYQFHPRSAEPHFACWLWRQVASKDALSNYPSEPLSSLSYPETCNHVDNTQMELYSEFPFCLRLKAFLVFFVLINTLCKIYSKYLSEAHGIAHCLHLSLSLTDRHVKLWFLQNPILSDQLKKKEGGHFFSHFNDVFHIFSHLDLRPAQLYAFSVNRTSSGQGTDTFDTITWFV